MPYNPGISNQAGALMAPGIERLGEGVGRAGNNVLSFLLDRQVKSKELRSMIKEAWPETSTSKMGLEDMMGFVQGKYQETKAQESALRGQLLRQQVAQGQAQAAAAAAAGSQLGPFFETWRSGIRPGTAPVNAGRPYSLPGVATPGADTTGAGFTVPGSKGTSALEAGLQAAAQYPQGAGAAGFSQDLPALLREALTRGGGGMGGGPSGSQGVVPWSLGDMSGGIESRTGKMFFDVDTTKKLTEARKPAASRATSGPPAGSTGLTYSADGKSWWNAEKQMWVPLPAGMKPKAGLFDAAGTEDAGVKKDPLGLFPKN